MIHFHIAYPAGSIDGSFSIAPCPIIEHLAPSNAHSQLQLLRRAVPYDRRVTGHRDGNFFLECLS
jgi:hypothetical protein